MTDDEFADRIRTACIEAALEAFEAAGISGLCLEGRWEIAIQAMRTLDLRPLVVSRGQADTD